MTPEEAGLELASFSETILEDEVYWVTMKIGPFRSYEEADTHNDAMLDSLMEQGLL